MFYPEGGGPQSHIRLPRIQFDRFGRSKQRKEISAQIALLFSFATCFFTLSLSTHPVFVLGAFFVQVLTYMQIGWLLHDAVHGCLYANRELNQFAGRLFISLSGIPYHFGKVEHLKHHRHLGLIKGDTELSDYSETEAKNRVGGAFLSHLLQSVPGRMIYYPSSLLLNVYTWSKRKNEQAKSIFSHELMIDGVFILAAWGGAAVWGIHHHCLVRCLVLGMIGPCALGLGLLSLGTQPIHTWMAAFPQPELSPIARTFYTSRSFDGSWLWRVIYANSSYHIEHHLYPTVSRWDLGWFARSIRSDLFYYAQAKHLPLMIHPGVVSWYREYWKLKKLYNPIVNEALFHSENRGFTRVTQGEVIVPPKFSNLFKAVACFAVIFIFAFTTRIR